MLRQAQHDGLIDFGDFLNSLIVNFTIKQEAPENFFRGLLLFRADCLLFLRIISPATMAQPTLPVIQALRDTAQRLATQAPYQWGHMGSCNCGHLAQTVTRLTKAEIHARAMQRYGDWERQIIDYCPTSGLPIDQTIDEMLALGFSRADLTHLERISDPVIRAAIPFERRDALRHNQRDDVVRYLRTWADLLECDLLAGITLPSFHPAPAPVPVLAEALAG